MAFTSGVTHIKNFEIDRIAIAPTASVFIYGYEIKDGVTITDSQDKEVKLADGNSISVSEKITLSFEAMISISRVDTLIGVTNKILNFVQIVFTNGDEIFIDNPVMQLTQQFKSNDLFTIKIDVTRTSGNIDDFVTYRLYT